MGGFSFTIPPTEFLAEICVNFVALGLVPRGLLLFAVGDPWRMALRLFALRPYWPIFLHPLVRSCRSFRTLVTRDVSGGARI